MEKNLAIRVSAVTVILNLLLSVFKAAAGILSHSGAMVSDAVHSASDVCSTLIVMIGITLSRKQSDSRHQYGHERMECVAAILLAVILAVTGFGVGIQGMERITGKAGSIQAPGSFALAAAVISIGVKEWMYWYTRAAAKKIHSGALLADAWHHRSDAFSSVGALMGILGARLGHPILDPVASIIICLFIVKAAYDVFQDAVGKMIDQSCPEDMVEKMRYLIRSQKGVEGIDDIKTRLFGSKIYVDVEISADGKKSLTEAHEIAENVHNVIEMNFPEVKHCMVHVNPEEKEA